MSRAQLLSDDDEQLPPSDSQVEDSESDDQGQVSQEEKSDTGAGLPQEPRLDVSQTLNETRQEDRKKGLAVSRQLVRYVYPFSNNYLMLWSQ